MSLHIYSHSIRNAALFAIAATAMTAQAQARVGTICLELPAGAGTVKAEIASGCLPTHPKYDGAFAISVDADRAVIAVDGAFNPTTQSLVGTADCMGSRVLEQEAEAAGPRRYSVMVNGEFRGVIDASDTTFGMRAVKQCFEGASQVKVARPESVTAYNRSMFNDWIARPKGKTTDPLYTADYSTIGDAVATLLGNQPETMEGRPSAEITISKARWSGSRVSKPPEVHFMAVRIEEYGYLDDSVSGKRTFAEIKQNEQSGAWSIVGHWYQWMCARGEKVGQWTAEACA